MEKRTLPVVGLACSACSANVEKKLNSLSGVKSASVNLLARTALVEYDATEISLEKMKSEVNAIGYDLVIESNRSAEAIERRELQLLKQSTLLSWVFAILCMCVSMGWLNLGGKAMNNQVALLLALANFVVCGRGFFVKSWQQLRHASANMDTLVALSTGIAFVFSAFNTFWGDAV